ncbi:hypothetical protein QOT17_015406 [Balamuthia mandrillaris]
MEATAWRHVPPELWGVVFSNCSFASVVRCCLLSKDFHRLASSDAVWKTLYALHFGTPVEAEVEEKTEEGWMKRFREAVLSPTWDRELSEKEVWLFSADNKRVKRDGNKGLYPKAIMSNYLFTLLDRFTVKLHFKMNYTGEFGLFTEPDMQQILSAQSTFFTSFTGTSCTYVSMPSHALFHRSSLAVMRKHSFPLRQLGPVVDYSMTLLIEETGSSSSSGNEETERRVWFWVQGKPLGSLPLPQRPYAFMYTAADQHGSIQLDRVEFTPHRRQSKRKILPQMDRRGRESGNLVFY